jgi:hypothetical protein
LRYFEQFLREKEAEISKIEWAATKKISTKNIRNQWEKWKWNADSKTWNPHLITTIMKRDWLTWSVIQTSKNVIQLNSHCVRFLTCHQSTRNREHIWHPTINNKKILLVLKKSSIWRHTHHSWISLQDRWRFFNKTLSKWRLSYFL